MEMRNLGENPAAIQTQTHVQVGMYAAFAPKFASRSHTVSRLLVNTCSAWCVYHDWTLKCGQFVTWPSTLVYESDKKKIVTLTILIYHNFNCINIKITFLFFLIDWLSLKIYAYTFDINTLCEMLIKILIFAFHQNYAKSSISYVRLARGVVRI